MSNLNTIRFGLKKYVLHIRWLTCYFHMLIFSNYFTEILPFDVDKLSFRQQENNGEQNITDLKLQNFRLSSPFIYRKSKRNSAVRFYVAMNSVFDYSNCIFFNVKIQFQLHYSNRRKYIFLYYILKWFSVNDLKINVLYI